MIARGPNVRPGATLSKLSILDIAPLLLYSLNLPIPEDMEGRMPEEIFEPFWLHHHPFRLGEGGRQTMGSEPKGAEAKGTDRITFDAEAEAEMASRLRALGYIE